jgi:hypothetical protein
MIVVFKDTFTYNIFISWLCIIGTEQLYWEYLDNDSLTLQSYVQCWRN